MPPQLTITCVVVLLIALFAWLLATAGRPTRVDRFARARALDVDAQGDRATLLRYLAHVRRRRTAGVLVALLGSVAVSLLTDDSGVVVPYAPLLAGWLAGAVLAELSSRPVTAGTPDTSGGGTTARPAAEAGWIRPIPWSLAGLTIVSTTAALALTPGPGQVPVARILGWGLAALACAGAVVAGNRAVLARPVFGGALAPPAERATRANAVGGVTAIGLLAAVACLYRQALAVHDATDGWQPVPGAVERAAVACGIGALIVAGLLVAAARPWPGTDGTITPTGPALPRIMAGVTVLALLTSATFVAAAWLDTRPPYPAAAVHPVATVRFTDLDHFTGDAAAIGAHGLDPLAGSLPHEFVGRLDMEIPPGAKDAGTYVLVVIDARANRMSSWINGPDLPGASTGWNGGWSVMAKRYPWLSATQSIYDDGDSGNPLGYMMNPDTGRSVAFEGLLASDSAALSPGDLSIALIFFGPDGQLYWATRVPVTAA